MLLYNVSAYKYQSPSLRGSGLKSTVLCRSAWLVSVSLFTREWIEIACSGVDASRNFVSLFTREWIEIVCPCDGVDLTFMSPSLRGSGLKSPVSLWMR